MDTVAQVSFEQGLAELTAIVEQLEQGALDLDATVGLYERGCALAAHCQHLLDGVELRVQQLVVDGEGGYTVVEGS